VGGVPVGGVPPLGGPPASPDAACIIAPTSVDDVELEVVITFEER